MMNEYEYVFCKTLHEKLKAKIKGGINAYITDDTLEIKIIRYGDIIFKMRICNISEKILNGYSTDLVVHEVVKKYKRFVLNGHFVCEENGSV